MRVRARVCEREGGTGDAWVHALSSLHDGAFNVQEKTVCVCVRGRTCVRVCE